MAKEIVTRIDKLGNIKVDANGFVGNTCADATKNYLLAVGGSQNETKKPEYYQPAASGQTVGAGRM